MRHADRFPTPAVSPLRPPASVVRGGPAQAAAPARRRVSGPALLGLLFGATAALAAGLLAFHGAGEEGFRSLVGATARVSGVLLVAVMAAAPVHRRWRSAAARRLLRERRWLGLSLAGSHALHLAGLVGLFSSGRLEAPLAVWILGGWGFACVAALAATSSDAAVRRLGRGWRRLHLAGIWSLWTIFAVIWAGRAAESAVAAGFLVALVAVAALRLTTPRAGGAPPADRLRGGSG